MERKYLYFLSCFPTWNKSLWYVDTSLYYKICLVSWDLLGALKETKACDDSDIFQYCLSEVLGGKRRMLLDTAVKVEESKTSAWVSSYPCLKKPKICLSSELSVFYLWEGKGSRRREGKLAAFPTDDSKYRVPLRLPQFLAVTLSLQTCNLLKFSCDLISCHCKVGGFFVCLFQTSAGSKEADRSCIN